MPLPETSVDPDVPSCDDNPYLDGCEPPPQRVSEETCEDNPYLAQCALLHPTSWGEAMRLLSEQCGDCHGRSAGLPGIPSLDFTNVGLAASGVIVPCSSVKSRLIQVLRDTDDPHATRGVPLQPASIDSLAALIDADCTPERVLCESEPTLEGCDVVQFESILGDSCGSCHGEGARRSRGDAPLENLGYIDQLQALIDNEKVVPCNWNASPLALRLADGTMPPADAVVAPMPVSELLTLANFVSGLCDELALAPADDPGRATTERVLSNSCGACHGELAVQLGQVQGGLSQIEDLGALLGTRQLIPCESAGSPILQRIQDGSMPPAGSGLPEPTSAEVAAMVEFIDSPCDKPEVLP